MHKHRFMNNLSSDVLKQNHRLKNELIQARKALKSYQNKIINELADAAKSIKFKSDFLLFQNSQEALEAFIKLVQQAIRQATSCSGSLAAKSVQQENLKIQLQNKIKILERKEQEIKQIQAKIEVVQANQKQLIKQLTKLKGKYDQEIQKSTEQIARLKLQLDTIDQKLNLKYRIEKKQIIEKYNKELFQYRKNVQTQFTMHQKLLRTQIQKKDRDMKGLLFTINNMISHKSQKKERSQKQDSIIHTESQGPALEQIKFLESIIKPFTDHTELNEKVSKLRKQLSETQIEKRQLTTQTVYLQNRKSQLKQQLQIIKKEMKILTKKYNQLSIDYEKVSQKNTKINEDMIAMEYYYENKWNQEFQSVKRNLQKKHDKKLEEFSSQHNEKMEELETEKTKTKIQVQMMKVKLQMIQNRNFYLEEENAKYQTTFIELKRQLENRIILHKESQLFANEDKQSLKFELASIIYKQKEKIKNQAANIKQLEDKLQKTIKKYEENIKKLMEDHKEQKMSLQKQMQDHEDMVVGQKNEKINDLQKIIIEHKEVIQDIQREISNKLDDARKQAQYNQQVVTKLLRMEHLNQISKFNEKIINFNLQISDLKAKLSSQKENQRHTELKYMKLIKQKQYTISQVKNRVSNQNAEKQKINEVLKNKQQELEELKEEKYSLEVLVNSKQLYINNLNEQIIELVNEKKKWINDIKNAKKEYQKGFKDIKDICDKRVSFYKSKIWELERVRDFGFINQRERQKIRSITQQKNKLQQQLNKKEAENLILMQVKNYYEHRASETETKIGLNYELRQFRQSKQPIFIQRPNNKSRKTRMRNFKTERSGNKSDFNGWHSTERKIKAEREQQATTDHKQSDMIYTPKQQPHGYSNNEIKKKINIPLNPAIVTDQELDFCETSKNFRVTSSLI